MSAVHIHVQPQTALVDESLQIRVAGLEPRQAVTLVGFLVEHEHSFYSYAFYEATVDGVVDLDRQASVGGMYTGVEPMGLVWSLYPCPGQKRGLRLLKRVVESPLVLELFVFAGHQVPVGLIQSTAAGASEDMTVPGSVPDRSGSSAHGSDTAEGPDGALLAECVVHRLYCSPRVQSFQVRSGKIRGTLFLPPGEGPFPGVIDMFGTGGGLNAMRAALLASRGFAALALAMFSYEDLPSGLELDMEYYKEAVDWLTDHPRVLKTGIGAVGVSKGAAMAIHMSIVSPKVRAVAAINPFCFHAIGIHYEAGVRQPVVNADLDRLYVSNDELVYGAAFDYKQEHDSAILQIDRSPSADFLFIIGEDDVASDLHHARVLVNRLRRTANVDHPQQQQQQQQRQLHQQRLVDSPGRFTVLSYPGAGHLIEPPFAPLCRACHTKIVGYSVLYGGRVKEHAAAQQDSWQLLLKFLHQRLTAAAADQPSSASTTSLSRL